LLTPVFTFVLVQKTCISHCSLSSGEQLQYAPAAVSFKSSMQCLTGSRARGGILLPAGVKPVLLPNRAQKIY